MSLPASLGVCEWQGLSQQANGAKTQAHTHQHPQASQQLETVLGLQVW